LADFLERTYLLHTLAPLLIVLIIAHVLLAARKLPSTAQQQLSLVRHLRSLWHFDTWLWAIQIVTGLALLSLVSIHLWEVLTDLPIEAAKSGDRVRQTLFLFSAPFTVLVQVHLGAGLYRIAVKWGLLARPCARAAAATSLALFVALDIAILVALHGAG